MRAILKAVMWFDIVTAALAFVALLFTWSGEVLFGMLLCAGSAGLIYLYLTWAGED